MRAAVLGLLVTIGVMLLGVGLSGPRETAFGQNTGNPNIDRLVAQGRLIALSSDVDATVQQVTLIDPAARTMAVYHVERSTGKIVLRSVRNIRWDLQLEEFNGDTPSPQDIRSLLERR